MSEPAPDTHTDHHGAEPAAAVSIGAAATGATGSDYASYTREMHQSMMKMMDDMHRDPPSGDPDLDFLVMMIPHHQGAVDMARLVIAAGHDPLVRSLAEDIMASQTAEIAGMQGRLAALRRGGSPDDTFPSPTGTRDSR